MRLLITSSRMPKLYSFLALARFETDDAAYLAELTGEQHG
jgi:hypothetical protein